MLTIIVGRGRLYRDCCIAFPWKILIAHITISTSFVWSEICILIPFCTGEEKKQQLLFAGWVLAPWYWGCLKAVCYKLERSAESLFKPWYSAHRPSGQGSKHKSLQSGYYYPKAEWTWTWMVFLWSFTWSNESVYNVLHSLFSLMCLRHCPGPVYVNIYRVLLSITEVL